MNKWGVGLTLLPAFTSVLVEGIQFSNVFYDPTHKLYEQCNKAFSMHWKQETGDSVMIRRLHGGSDKQATPMTNGIEANVVILTLVHDVDAIAEHGRVDKNWLKHLPDNSVPYTSTIVLLVRKGNPKQVHDRNDLTKPGASVITPNPKSSGGARRNYLAAWGYTLHQNHGDQVRAQEFVRALYRNVEVPGSDTRGLANTFVEYDISDVLIVWKNETLLAASELDKDKLEIVTPSKSILAEPTASVVDRVVDKKGTRQVAEAHLKYLYLPEDQGIVTKNFYCPRDPNMAKEYANEFPRLKLLIIDQESDSWTKAQREHFSNGGILDQISQR